MKIQPKYFLIFFFTILFFGLKAQILIEEYEYIEQCPEMVVGKVYTGKDIRAVKSLYPKGLSFYRQSLADQYPFAKITNGKYVTLLVFDNELEGKLIHLHAYIYDMKLQKKQYASSYIYSDGTNAAGTVYEASIELTEKNKIVIDQTEDGRRKISNYKVGKKKFEYSSK